MIMRVQLPVQEKVNTANRRDIGGYLSPSSTKPSDLVLGFGTLLKDNLGSLVLFYPLNVVLNIMYCYKSDCFSRFKVVAMACSLYRELENKMFSKCRS